MNAILLGAASLGALLAIATHDADGAAAKAAADDAEVARLMEAAPDVGSFQPVTITDPATGETAKVNLIAFKE